MRGVSGQTVLGIIGAIYAIGLVIHFWWLFALILAIFVYLGVLGSVKRSKQARATTSQARYSNRR